MDTCVFIQQRWFVPPLGAHVSVSVSHLAALNVLSSCIFFMSAIKNTNNPKIRQTQTFPLLDSAASLLAACLAVSFCFCDVPSDLLSRMHVYSPSAALNNNFSSSGDQSNKLFVLAVSGCCFVLALVTHFMSPKTV